MANFRDFKGLPRNKGRTTGQPPKGTPRNMEKHPAFNSGRTMNLGLRSKIDKNITKMKLRGE